MAASPIACKETQVDVAYTVKGSSYGFELAAYDNTKELIIDPLITAYFQGATDTYTLPTCLAADDQGNIYTAASMVHGRGEKEQGSA
jgi:hypothetical protein